MSTDYSQVEYHVVPVDFLQSYNWVIAPNSMFSKSCLGFNDIYEFTEEPMAVLKMAASTPRNNPRTPPSPLKMVDSASKEFL